LIESSVENGEWVWNIAPMLNIPYNVVCIKVSADDLSFLPALTIWPLESIWIISLKEILSLKTTDRVIAIILLLLGILAEKLELVAGVYLFHLHIESHLSGLGIFFKMLYFLS